MPDITLSLGDVTFQGFEVPEEIPFGGEQKLAVHEMIGGVRVVDAMGRADGEIAWSGRFRGADAVARARQVDAMRISGAAQTLTWGGFSYLVVIKSFQGKFERFYEVPYTLACVVVADNVAPSAAEADDDADQAVDQDMQTAAGLGADIGDSGLNALIGQVQSALDALPSVVSAAPSQLLGVLAPVQAAQAQVTVIAAGLTSAIDGDADFGGLTAGADPGALVTAFNATTTAALALPNVYAAGGLLGRVATNLGAVGVSGRQVTQAGGDLYRLATTAYGDPSGWTAIAEANGVSDPILTGVNTLRVPPVSDGTDGVLLV